MNAQHEVVAPPVSTTTPAVATSATLFGCLFAAQSGLLVLTPTLSRVAADLHVPAAAAGQLRAVSGATAAVVALTLVATRRRSDLRGLLTLGLSLLAGAAIGSATAPTYWVLAAMQAVFGGGLALVVAGGLAAAATWAPAGTRATALSWALVGQPAAWIIGMPVVGFLGGHSWRLAWLVPLAASVLALAGVSRQQRNSPEQVSTSLASLLYRPGVGRWAVAELLAFAGWAGVMVYVGVLLTDAHGLSVAAAGVALAAGAVGHVVGTFLAGRWVVERAAERTLRLTGPALAATALLLGVVRPTAGFSVAVFAAIAFLAGARMIASSAIGLDLDGVGPLQAMGMRAAAMQLGYLGGAALGGLGLTFGGWPGLGGVLAALLLLSAVVTAATGPTRTEVRTR
ncbi:MAG TPA: MFS transporter [Pilimelia sp.]|nr:MFS transporter [Pilimelia sp.]